MQAYDSLMMRLLVRAHGYLDHVRSRGEEKAEKISLPGYRARRWVVERTHSWLNRSRRLLVRWAKKTSNYLAFLHLACAQLLFTKRKGFSLSSRDDHHRSIIWIRSLNASDKRNSDQKNDAQTISRSVRLTPVAISFSASFLLWIPGS